MCKFAYTIKKYAQLLINDVMARFYSLKKKDEEDARIADPFGVLRSVPKTSSGKQTKEQHIMTKVYVFLADGFEDVEALAPVDVLRRGGVGVVTVSINGSDMVKSAHNVYVKADVRFEEADFSDADLLMIPGGMPGAKNLTSTKVCAMLFSHMPSKANFSVPSAPDRWFSDISDCLTVCVPPAIQASKAS